MTWTENYCHGCERELGIARSMLYCRKCNERHIVCFGCLFDPDVNGFVPRPEDCPTGGYWARCPIPILVKKRGERARPPEEQSL